MLQFLHGVNTPQYLEKGKNSARSKRLPDYD
jgi:hypothetical protein